MALLLEAIPRETADTIRTHDRSKENGGIGTKVETRIHQRQCKQCRRWFWAWDPERHRCFLCDAPPPRELRRILEEIHGTTR